MRQGAIHSRGSRSSLATIRFPRVVDQGMAWGIQKLVASRLPPLRNYFIQSLIHQTTRLSFNPVLYFFNLKSIDLVARSSTLFALRG